MATYLHLFRSFCPRRGTPKIVGKCYGHVAPRTTGWHCRCVFCACGDWAGQRGALLNRLATRGDPHAMLPVQQRRVDKASLPRLLNVACRYFPDATYVGGACATCVTSGHSPLREYEHEEVQCSTSCRLVLHPAMQIQLRCVLGDLVSSPPELQVLHAQS